MGQRMPLYMAEVPDYEVHDGHVHILWRDLEIVLPVSVMLAGMAGAEEAIAKWQIAKLGSEVVELPRRR